MPQDRFVYWNPTSPPRTEAVIHALRTYLNGIARVEWSQTEGRYFAEITGRPAHPDHRLRATLHEGSRTIEVFFHVGESVNIMTRSADLLTGVIADGFARFCTRRWQGRFES